MNKAAFLNVHPVKTRIFSLGESLSDFIVEQVDRKLVEDCMILAITSKIVSLAENRVVERSAVTKAQLIDQEADYNLGEVGYGCFLTIKHGLFIPSAGIDESNSEKDHYILYPENPFASAKALWQDLKERWNIKNLGILMTDSHTTPLRRGVTGISVAHWGFRGLRNLIGTPDLFGRHMKMTTVNVADAFASAATLLMGESNESCPLAIVRSSDVEYTEEIDVNELRMPLQEDLYYPFFAERIQRLF